MKQQIWDWCIKLSKDMRHRFIDNKVKSKIGKCEYCGKEAKLTKDHVIPYSYIHLGNAELAKRIQTFAINGAWCCSQCNIEKDSKIWSIAKINGLKFISNKRKNEFLRTRKLLVKAMHKFKQTFIAKNIDKKL